MEGKEGLATWDLAGDGIVLEFYYENKWEPIQKNDTNRLMFQKISVIARDWFRGTSKGARIF